jgi:hypothetical protein
MRSLTPNDLMPLAEYAVQRAEFFDAHWRYCEQYRRVHVGRVVLTFENRQTLWFRLQEVLHVLRLREVSLVRGELERCNELLPRPDHLVAGLTNWDGRRLEHMSFGLTVGGALVPGQLAAPRPEDRALGIATWVDFEFTAADRIRLANRNVPARIELEHEDKRLVSDPLAEDVRQSLLDDLTIDAREAA